MRLYGWEVEGVAAEGRGLFRKEVGGCALVFIMCPLAFLPS